MAANNGEPSPQGTCANSFNYLATPIAIPARGDWATCTGFSAAPHADAVRQLWLADAGELRLYETDTADFSRADIARIKTGLSHLFFDRSPPGVLDDFVEGMRRVMPEPICDPCPHRDLCGRRYRVVEGPPFAAEESWIAEHVAGLHGRVLDVGCGEQLYLDRLVPLVRDGTVQYTGLDPDEIALARMRTTLPEATLLVGGIEDVPLPARAFEHVLCLRSLNHVADLNEAFSRMAAALVPGGRLLLVETTPFAMLRRREQVAAADRAPRAGHQHFRNVSSEQILPLAERYGLGILHHRPIGLDRSNEWILLLEKEGAV